MARLETSVVINRPIEDVFAYMGDVGSWSEWQEGMSQAEQTSEGPMGVGTTFRGLSQMMGRKMEWTSEVTEYEPNSKVAQKIISGPMWMEQRMTFEPVEGGTKLTLSGEGETGGFFKIAERLVVGMMKKQMEGNLARLKGILEGQA